MLGHTLITQLLNNAISECFLTHHGWQKFCKYNFAAQDSGYHNHDQSISWANSRCSDC